VFTQEQYAFLVPDREYKTIESSCVRVCVCYCSCFDFLCGRVSYVMGAFFSAYFMLFAPLRINTHTDYINMRPYFSFYFIVVW